MNTKIKAIPKIFVNLILLSAVSLLLSSCASTPKNYKSKEIPTPQAWFAQFESPNQPPLSSESLSWLENKKVEAEHLSEESLFELPFRDRMTVLLLRRAYYLGANPLPFDGQSLAELLFNDPRLKGWMNANRWVQSKDPKAFAQKNSPDTPMLFLELEADQWRLNLLESLNEGLRPYEVKYSRLGSMGLGLALNFLALQGEKGVGDFLLKPLMP